jgi:glutamate racemase
MKVGVFDSGIGGITVLEELRKRIPAARYVYLGDTAHVPYGTKSPAQIQRLSVNCASTLKDKGVDALVVACNTASSWALPAIREVMGEIPVLGVVEPGAEAAVVALKAFGTASDTPLLVLATRATVQSGAYARTLERMLGMGAPARSIVEQPCPLLVPMIEEGWLDHPILHQTIEEYVHAHRMLNRGVALLGCTHYPWIHAAFEKALPGWTVVNSAQAVARSLEAMPLFRDALAQGVAGGQGGVEWIFTDPQAVPAFARARYGLTPGS